MSGVRDGLVGVAVFVVQRLVGEPGGGTPFIAGSAVGYVPQMMVFALVGSGIGLDPVFRIGLSAVLFMVSGFLGIHLYRKHRHGKTFDDEVGRQLGGIADGDGDDGSGPAGGRPAGSRPPGQG